MRRGRVLVAGVALALVSVAPVYAQGAPGNSFVTPPQQVNVTNTTVLQVPPRDPQEIADDSTVAYQSLIVNVAQPVPSDWANELCNLPDIWRTTPAQWTSEQPTINDLSKKVAGAALGLLALAILAQGLGHALGQELQLGRVALAVVLVFGNLSWWQIGIGLNNAISSAIGAPDVCASLIRPHLELQHPDPGAQVGGAVLVIVYALVSLLLLISLAFRLGLIDVLIVAGPLALMCWSTQQSEHLAQWYTRIAVGTVFGQVLLVIGLQVAGVLSGLGNGLAGTLLSMVVLLLCRSLLGTLSSQSAQNGGARMGMGMFLLLRRLVAKV